MKKYKLIKEYPGSPKLGTIVERIQDFSTPYNYGTKNRNFIVSSLNVEHHTKKNLEFWEEVIEKDYEILSYCQNSNGCGRFIYEKSHPNWGFIKKQNYEINTVKRVSDGEVFTVDDYVQNMNYPEAHFGKIKKMYIKSNEFMVEYSNVCDQLKNISHKNKLLFTTEDGVDIFEGDEVWGITKDVWKPFYRVAKNTPDNVAVNEKWLHGKFSTKEAAEEYILMNKPCLSINDVENSVVGKLQGYFRENLKDIVKSKV